MTLILLTPLNTSLILEDGDPLLTPPMIKILTVDRRIYEVWMTHHPLETATLPPSVNLPPW